MERAGKVDGKKWAILFAAFAVAIVGLVIAIVIILIVRNNTNNGNQNTSNTQKQELTEQEIKEEKLQIANSDYTVINEAITKVVEVMNEPEENDIISLYEYYIGETNSEYLKAMLQSDLLLILMGYDKDNTRGDELVEEAKVVDGVLETPNSAALIVNIAYAYGKTDLAKEYEEIMHQREIDSGYDINAETEG